MASALILTKVAACSYRNGHGTYFALLKAGGKQIKRSLKNRRFGARTATARSPANESARPGDSPIARRGDFAYGARVVRKEEGW